jgi:hypothetical protein
MAKSTEKTDTGSTNDKQRFAAYVVVDAVQGENARKAQWHRIGVAYPHDDSKGFNIEFPPGVTVSGRIVVRQDEPRDANRNA